MRNLAALLLFAPSSAFAGIGSTAGIGTGGIYDLASAFNGRVGTTANGFLPTLDWHAEPLVLQFHVLETLDRLADEDVFIGANVYYQVKEGDLGGKWTGVIQPGGGIDLWGDPFILVLTAEARLGAQSIGDMGFGVHVVPAAGVYITDGDTDLVVGGTVQIGAWIP